jgi:hypothetical protein
VAPYYIKYLTVLLTIGSLATGLWAAYKWWQASVIEVPQGFAQSGISGITRRMAPPHVVRAPEAINAEIERMNEMGLALEAVAKSARLNKQAAFWTAISVALSTLAALVGLAAS